MSFDDERASNVVWITTVQTLQRTLNTIAVRRLAYTEVLAEEYKCDYYGVALGMRNEDFRGLVLLQLNFDGGISPLEPQ